MLRISIPNRQQLSKQAQIYTTTCNCSEVKSNGKDRTALALKVFFSIWMQESQMFN